jgi:hypothetical protein
MVGPWGLFVQAALQSAARTAMWWGRAEPKPTGWRLPGCAILLQDLLRGGIQLLDSAQCNLLTLKKKKKKKTAGPTGVSQQQQ